MKKKLINLSIAENFKGFREKISLLLPKLLVPITALLIPICIYCSITESNSTFRTIVYISLAICFILSLLCGKHLLQTIKQSSIERYMSLLGLEIALIVFIQSSIQVEKNNEQFRVNRIESDSLFKKQLLHAKALNDSLIKELNEIQKISKTQSSALDAQLLTTQKQLTLSEQSLNDYLYETKSNLSIGPITLSKTDSITNIINNRLDTIMKLRFFFNVENIGKREAFDIELNSMLIYKDSSVSSLVINKDLRFLNINSPNISTLNFEVLKKDSKDFYIWIQTCHHDEKLDTVFCRSYYQHYFKRIDNTLGFCIADNNDSEILRRIVDRELKRHGHKLTMN